MNINWYPGHMKKTSEAIKDNIKKVDIVFELIDARIPKSSQNPIIPDLIGDKDRIVIFNKGDLADDFENKKWLDFYKRNGITASYVNSNTGKGIKDLLSKVDILMEEKRRKDLDKGIISDEFRAMIVGIPNVGKSTLINSLSNRKSANTGNKPGVTKSNQWINIRGKFKLLDTPGVLWPKFETEETALNLAFTGAIKDEILPIEDIALKLIELLKRDYPKYLEDRYKISVDNSALEIMEDIAKKRGAIFKGNVIDYERVSKIILSEFRDGTIGKITLEKVSD